MTEPGVVELTLYVRSGSHRSTRAVRNLRRMLAESGQAAELEIVDVLDEPARVTDDGVVATPMLLRRGPGFQARIVGDLSLEDVVLPLLRPGFEGAPSDRAYRAADGE